MRALRETNLFNMKQIFLFIIIALQFSTKTNAQGCVAIRGGGGVCTMQHMDTTHEKKWQLITSYRYFKSFRHFVGKEEQVQRQIDQTEVINWQHYLNYTFLHQINNRWSVGLDVPVVVNTRSSLYEHYGNTSKSPNARQQTHSYGLGDMRISGYYWLKDTAHSKKGNVRLGVGVKLPTGNYQVQDMFKKNDTTLVLGPVDQSIQLGDGGLGFTAELNAYYNFNKQFSLYGNFYYLMNPRNHNGVSTARGGVASQQTILIGSSVMSVPDQYMLRGGLNFNYKKLTVSGGVRMECIPVKDLIGGNYGFRRPGYIISAEPGLNYESKKITLYATVPFAIERNRTQSVPDKNRTALTGVYYQGDAAFADYSINAGMVISF